jgi:hypothetical protein
MTALARLLDVFHVCLVNHLIYYYLITNYANPPALVKMVWSFKVRSDRNYAGLSPSELRDAQALIVVDVSQNNRTAL